MKDSDWWIESRDGKVGAAPNFQSYSTLSRLAACQPVFCSSNFYHLRDFKACKMVGAENTDELLLGYSPDGMFEIVLRPGKFFFQAIFFVLCQFF